MISHKRNLAIQLFGPGTESVPITGMTGRQLEAALRHYAMDDMWTGFLCLMLRKFRAVGGQPGDRVACRLDLTPRGLFALMRDASSADIAYRR
jgi:hypothetical protein